MGVPQDRYPLSGPGDPDHFGQHPVGVEPPDYGAGHGYIETTVGEGQCLGCTLPKLDQVFQALFIGQGRGLPQEEPVNVYADNTVASAGTSGSTVGPEFGK